MSRPRRLYLSKEGKYYYIENNKKKYIRVPPGMSQKQVQTINIKNIVGGPARRMRRKKKKTKIAYQKRVVKDTGDMIRGYTAGLPLYYFTPQKNITIDIATKASDTTIDKLVDLLKGATPVIKTPKMEPPPVVEPKIPKFTEMKPEPKTEPRPRTPPSRTAQDVLRDLEKEDFLTPEQKRFKSFLEKESATRKEFIKKDKEPSETDFTKKIEGFRKRIAEQKEVLKDVQKSRETFEKKINELEPILEPIAPGLKKKIDQLSPEQRYEFYRKRGERLAEKDIREMRARAEDSKENIDMGEEKTMDGKGDDGLYNDQIQNILQKRIKNFVPVVPADKVEDLLRYVGRGQKVFSAVVNTDNSSGEGKHWTCVFFDNRDDFPSCEFFDPLAEDGKPPEALLSVMRKISKRMNPEKYFKYKFNKIRRQSLLTSNCGYHVCKFIEDRYDGIPFSEASGYDDYMKRQKGDGYEAPDDSKDGEKEIKPYMSLLKKNFSSYL
jgi:hypothetical protein